MWCGKDTVIASAAKQSRDRAEELDCFVARAPRNDEKQEQTLDKNSFFWKMVDGRLPPPPCAKTLGLEFVQVDGERGTIETKFEATGILLNPAGNVHGGFLSAMIDDT